MEQQLLKIYLSIVVVISMLVLISSGFLFWGHSCIFDFEKKNQLAANQLAVLPSNLPGMTGEAVAEEPLKMLFFGDMMLDRNVGTKIKQFGLDYFFEKTKDTGLFESKDLIGVNLEGSVTNGGKHYPPNNSYDFAFLPENVEKLKTHGFNFLNLANNHFSDQGERGMAETRQNLDSLGFGYSGCPDGQIGECSGKIVEIKNQKIGLVGFSMVYSKLDQDKLKLLVSDFASRTDFLVINIHWGVEYQHNFSPIQQETAHHLIDAGADLVIGHHPHVVQGIEIYQGKPIFYSLGNFIFDQYFSTKTQQDLGVLIDLNKKEQIFSLIPLVSKRGQIELMADKDQSDFFSKLISWSAADNSLSEQIKAGEIILAR